MNNDITEAVRIEVNKAVETSAIITDGIPTLNIMSSIVLGGEEPDYLGCVACSDMADEDPEEHLVQLATTVLKSLIVFITDTTGKERAREVFADSLLEALVQSGLEDAKFLLKEEQGKPNRNKKWKDNPWFKHISGEDDNYEFKKI